ncbi:putative Ovochymase-1 [Hypsibius exemplaris]|uniref:Ovochymase-1 n=1 Tax=Hypsibius exemplaris TaxID=2072580 RepID=A0A1W0X7P4_HYPEX|nr:putative Ovochymase-1 [Hypsibius exemplaris]
MANFFLLGLGLTLITGANACGRPAIIPYSSNDLQWFTKIVGGIEAKQGSWPWQVNINYRKPGWAGIEIHLICGGSIINERFIVTAAHCIASDQTPSKYVVRAGDHDRTYPEASERIHEVKRFLIHPNYNAGTLSSDIAIIELQTPLRFSREISSVCLPPAGSDPANGRQCVATGWGETQVTPWEGLLRNFAPALKGQSSVLIQVRVNIISRQTCAANYYRGLLTDQMICAGFEQGGRDPCKADSGGPLVSLNSGGAYELVGITSWGHGCALARKPGVYVRVGSFTEWIQANTRT